jgi:hypothetical protein
MKKTYLLLFLCSISNITIFASENKKENSERAQLEEIEHLIILNKEEIDQIKKIQQKTARNEEKLAALLLKYPHIHLHEGGLLAEEMNEIKTGSASLNVLK